MQLQSVGKNILGRLTDSAESLKAFLFNYETPRVITVHNYRVGLIYRCVQLCIVTYLLGYVFMWEKSYQEFASVESSVTTKVKGILQGTVIGQKNRKDVWDAADFVFPAQETNAFFIATTVIHTVNQTQSECAEDPNVSRNGIICNGRRDCARGDVAVNGVKTGRCVPWNSTVKTCEISAWCPLEVDEPPSAPLLSSYESLTVLVKNHVAFPKFGVKRRNILDSINQTYLETCRFHPSNHPFCPVFSIKDIVKLAGEDFMETATRGAIIGFGIQWNCDLDFNIDYCRPVYAFRRLDDKDDQIARGWNFRYSRRSVDHNGKDRRDLIKLWGIRFVFNVSGRAGRFSAVNFLLTIGSGIGLLGLASLVCEFLLLTCVRPPHRNDLIQQKFCKV
ncbi:P2X purinoceptor 4 [Hypsibius exemplaris]|uniref:P2X purinoceptor 4 n=1 Tax=Hypsibius exemplaris TaxID=2072580 RepID=A0A1W0WA52_HYPEX|nr:P2X purinoceptor 4 [Hypsibius exemplaris]